MELNALMALTLVGMLVAILAGVHIALALGITALVGTYFIFEDWYLASAQVGGAAQASEEVMGQESSLLPGSEGVGLSSLVLFQARGQDHGASGAGA